MNSEIPALLRTQRNAILTAVERHGFSTRDFKWRPTSASWTGMHSGTENPALWHLASSGEENYGFTIGEVDVEILARSGGRIRRRSGEFCVTYCPGGERRNAEEFQLKWAEVLDHADTWARRLREEVSTVDLWEGAFEGDPFTQIIGGEPDSEAELTSRQKDVIQERLGHVEARVRDIGDLVADVERRLLDELAMVKVDVATLERKQAQRSVLGWFWRAAMVGVRWETVMEMYQTFVTAGPDLLPPAGL